MLGSGGRRLGMDAYWGWWIVAAVLAGAELVTNTF
jgi:hypothetical protein